MKEVNIKEEKAKEEKVFIYGTQYYRPPNPPADQHRYHLEKIKRELGFNLIRLRLQWNAIHRTPDRLDVNEIESILDICDELDLNVFAEISLESAPYWLEKKYPETRYVSANGQTIELGPYDSTQSGGYPGLCFHNSMIVKEAQVFVKKLVGILKGRKCLSGYDCWNEPHLEPAWICNYWGNMGDRLFCYCSASRNEFRRWLSKKYGDIEVLNSTWARMYNGWEDINPPNRHGTYADWLDWIRFWFDSLNEQMMWRYKAIKEEDPERFVMSHSGAVPPFLARPNAFIDNWSLAKPVDIWGTSFAPKYHNWSLAECAGTMEAARSAAGGKEFWISEMSGGSVYKKGFWKTPPTRPRDVRAWNWLAVAYGAKAIIYWCYLTESTGPEAGSFGLIKYNGEATERSREAARQNDIIKQYHNIFRDYVPKTDAAILYDPDNSSLLFAMENTDELYVQSHIGYYRAVWENDLYARYVTYSSIEDLKEKVLIAPMCLTLDEKTAEKIRQFVRNGGILIAEARMGLFDERGFLQADLPSYGLKEAAGLTEDEAVCSSPDNRPWLNNPDGQPWPGDIYGGPEISIDRPVKTAFRAHGYLSPLILQSAECLGKWENIPLVTCSQYGKGRVYYFGTYLGLALFNRDRGAFSILSAILDSCLAPKIKGCKLRPRLVENKDEGLLMVFNDSRFDALTESMQVPERYRDAFDIVNGKKVPVIDGRIEVAVEPEDVVIFHVT